MSAPYVACRFQKEVKFIYVVSKVLNSKILLVIFLWCPVRRAYVHIITYDQHLVTHYHAWLNCQSSFLVFKSELYILVTKKYKAEPQVHKLGICFSKNTDMYM
jgi:hypothetical protein